jgi:ferredoxin-NADP reductase
MLFLTGGSGITPVMSMLRTLDRRDQITDVIHLHSAPTAADMMFGTELDALSRKHDSYRLQQRATRTEGRLDLSRLDELVPDWRDRQVWACGPEGMLNDAERVWASAGLAGNLHLERFAVTRAAPQGVGGTVEFARSGKTVEVDAATPLMDAGEDAGIRMPFGCRMGICQSCVVGLVEGRCRTRAGQPHPDVRLGRCRRLRTRHMRFTDW